MCACRINHKRGDHTSNRQWPIAVVYGDWGGSRRRGVRCVGAGRGRLQTGSCLAYKRMGPAIHLTSARPKAAAARGGCHTKEHTLSPPTSGFVLRVLDPE